MRCLLAVNTVAELKDLMPEDAKEATGHGIRPKRSKSPSSIWTWSVRRHRHLPTLPRAKGHASKGRRAGPGPQNSDEYTVPLYRGLHREVKNKIWAPHL